MDDPAGSPPNVTTPAQNLLGINDHGQAAEFWTDNNGHEHGFVVELDIKTPGNSKFIEIPPSTFTGAVATQASDVTDKGNVCGFWTDRNGNNHGFFGPPGLLSTLPWLFMVDVEIDGVAAASTSPFGAAMTKGTSLVPSQIPMATSTVSSSTAAHSFNLMPQVRRRPRPSASWVHLSTA